ncbi:hypothetical protein AAY473_021830 [Plecturocebus cupreus]
MGFHHVARLVLNSRSHDSPASASQSAEITDRVLLSYPDWSAVVCSGFTAASTPRLKQSYLSHLSMHHYTQLIFVGTGFCHISKVGRELLSSSDPPTSTSQSAGITGVSRQAQPGKLLMHSTTVTIPTGDSHVMNSSHGENHMASS